MPVPPDGLKDRESLCQDRLSSRFSFSRPFSRQNLHQHTLERESREIARLGQVITLAVHDGCQTAFLAEHFGERLPYPCGHCSWCENGQPAKLFPGPRSHLDEARLREGISLRRETPDLANALAGSRAFTRFLTGLPSPRLTRGKFKSHPLFGAFAHVSFAEVLRRAEEMEGGGLSK